MFKQNRITLDAARLGLSIFESIPIRYVAPDFIHALNLSKRVDMYAYDAYFLDCAVRYRSPLMTLDRKLKAAARILGIETLEV